MSFTITKVVTYSAYALGAYALGASMALVFTQGNQPKGTRYGSRYHAWVHKWGYWGGRIGHVRAVCMGDETHEPCHVKVFGLVCDQCGFVNVNSQLSEDRTVEEEICGCSTHGFNWTTRENLSQIKLKT